jgi:hypothetical protein
MIKKMTAAFIFTCFLAAALTAGEKQELKLDKPMASKFAAMAMHCIEKEYPNKPGHVINNEKEVLNPKTLHPAFYGCFDWHSAVHGHWMLVRLLKTFPHLPETANIREALNRNLTALEKAIVKRYMDFLPKQTYAIRTGVHPNTAFGLAFALDYARTAKNKKLEEVLVERSYFYYYQDKNCPANWEPGGEDFFSPCLMEAALMQRVLKPEDFVRWFHAFLPQAKEGKPWSLMEPAIVTDRSDGKLVHLDGLNLSRAWCMKRVARALPKGDPAREKLLKAALQHTEDALKNIHSGEYAGEHWLASFATYLLTTRRVDPLVEPLREGETYSFIWLGTIGITASGNQQAARAPH